jgi:putative membrane protein insertion efficiency factor
MKYLCIALIKFYRKYLSRLKSNPTCRFTPTCSAYALEAYRKRGFIVGTILTVWRILRCNPFCAGGYDPVPEHGLRNRDTVPKGISLCDDDCDDGQDSVE